ncbi:MAG: DNA primase small subunit domain-containing protein [Nitrososphaerales archaeon]
MIRHLSYKNEGELKAQLVKEAPRAFYYSIAYYYEPTLPMQEKGWKGADIAFDIDCDDLNLECKKEHDIWSCSKCGRQGRGNKPKRCICGSTSFTQLNMVCRNCLNGAKHEANKLIEILISDLGFTKKQIKVYFSGSKGYHIILEDTAYENLDQMGRMELADYVCGRGLIPEFIGISKRATADELISRLPRIDEGGWRGRIAEYFANKGKEDPKKNIIELYTKTRYSGFKKVLEECARQMGATIDTNVTTDVHRILRLPGTLHGETGLIKKRVYSLDEFNPFVDAVAFGEEKVEVEIIHALHFTMLDQNYKFKEAQKVKLPLAAAVYLLGQGLAKMV